MPSQARVLMVCLGNICRSPLAEGVFQSYADHHNIEARFDSAGTAAFHVGKPPDPRAIRAASAKGIDIERLRARQLAKNDFYVFDQIFVMDQANLNDVLAKKPADATASIDLVMSLAPAHRFGLYEVPDPYYGGDDGFYDVLDMLDAAAQSWVGKHLSLGVR